MNNQPEQPIRAQGLINLHSLSFLDLANYDSRGVQNIIARGNRVGTILN